MRILGTRAFQTSPVSTHGLGGDDAGVASTSESPATFMAPSALPKVWLWHSQRPSRAGGTCGTRTGMIAQRGPLSRGPLSWGTTSIRLHRAEGPCAKSQVSTLGNPSSITTGSNQTGSGKIALGTSPRKEKRSGPGTEGWHEAEGKQTSPSQTPLHSCSSCIHALVLVRLVSCLPTLSPSSQHLFPHPRQSTQQPGPCHIQTRHALASQPPTLPLCWRDNPRIGQWRCCGC